MLSISHKSGEKAKPRLLEPLQSGDTAAELALWGVSPAVHGAQPSGGKHTQYSPLQTSLSTRQDTEVAAENRLWDKAVA